jgi:preprotein translocase subunit SecF
MFNFAERRHLYFLISALIIIPGVLAMVYSVATFGSPVKLSIDFTGGTLLDVSFVENQNEQDVRDTLADFGLDDYVVQRLDPISTEVIEAAQEQAGSRWQITLPNTVDLEGLKDFLSGADGLGEFWSSVDTEDDPDRENAINTTLLPDRDRVILDVSFVDDFDADTVAAAVSDFGVEGAEVERLETLKPQAGSRWQLRTEELETERLDALKAFLSQSLGDYWTLTPSNPEAEISSSSVSATVGKEVTRAAFVATMAVAVIVLGFIVFAFRKVPQSFRYGACAIAAMFHDILVTMGVMSILGLLFGCAFLDRDFDRGRFLCSGLYRGVRPHPRKHPQVSR